MLKISFSFVVITLLFFACGSSKYQLSENEFLVVHVKDEVDGQTITLRDKNNKEYNTVVSIANGNWIELVRGQIVSLEITDTIDTNSNYIITKSIKIIPQEQLKEVIVSSISTTKKIYSLEEPIELEMKVENVGNESFTFLPWKTPIENCFTGESLTVIYNNEKIEYSGILVKRMPPNEEDYITLKPNESVTGKVDLLEGYKFSRKGMYHIQFEGGKDNLPNSNVLQIKIQ